MKRSWKLAAAALAGATALGGLFYGADETSAPKQAASSHKAAFSLLAYGAANSMANSGANTDPEVAAVVPSTAQKTQDSQSVFDDKHDILGNRTDGEETGRVAVAAEITNTIEAMVQRRNVAGGPTVYGCSLNFETTYAVMDTPRTNDISQPCDVDALKHALVVEVDSEAASQAPGGLNNAPTKIFRMVIPSATDTLDTADTIVIECAIGRGGVTSVCRFVGLSMYPG